MELQFNIGETEYRVPDYISIRTFEKAIVWDLEDLRNLKPFVATIVGCPLSDLNKLDDEVLAFITGVCLQRIQVQGSELKDKVGLHGLKPFEDYTFGNFIDLDMFMTQSVGQNLAKIAALLYDATEDDVLDWDVCDIWGAVETAARWRESVYREYEEFFELDAAEPSDSDPSEANIGLMWYNAIIALADEDFLKIHQVTERPYRECLNFLNWKKAKAQREKLEILKRKNDLQRSFR